MSVMETLAAMLAAAGVVSVLILLLWSIARGSHRLLGYGALMDEAVRRCASCAHRPVCETGALAAWPGHPAGCPTLELLRKRTPL